MADAVVVCPHCRAAAEVPARHRGGLVNCRQCGRAIEVPGLRDPLWWLLVAAAVAAIAAVATLAAAQFGLGVGLLTGAGLGGLAWLLARAL